METGKEMGAATTAQSVELAAELAFLIEHHKRAGNTATLNFLLRYDALSASLASAEAVNAELVGVLRELVGEYFGNSVPSADIDAMYERARAALARAGGSKPKEQGS